MRVVWNFLIDRFSGRELFLLLAVLVAVGGTWAFIELADEVKEEQTQAFDERILLALRRAGEPETPIGPAWLHGVGRDITALGGFAVLIIVAVAVTGFLMIRRQYHAAWFVLISAVGGMLIGHGLKLLIARERPSVVPHLHEVTSLSFPSGHAMMSAVVYLTLGALLARLVVEWRARIYVLSIALFLTLIVGASRVYMGVHYPTDVLAGWTAGAAWALLCWFIALYLQRRGAVEKADETTDSPAMAARARSS